jgi:hypothetical protein
VYVSGGTLSSNVSDTLHVFGKYTQLSNTTLELNTDGRCAGRVQVGGYVTLAGGKLHVKLKSGFKPRLGAILNVIDTQAGIRGRFASITVDGYRARPVYTRNSLYLLVTP